MNKIGNEMAEEKPQTQRRLGAVEREVYEVKSHIVGLETNINNIQAGQDNLNHKLDMITSMVQSQGRTNWSVLGTWAGILLTLIMALGTAVFAVMKSEVNAVRVLTEVNREVLGQRTVNRWTASQQNQFQAELFRRLEDLETDVGKLEAEDKQSLRERATMKAHIGMSARDTHQ